MNYSIPTLASVIVVLLSSTYLTVNEKWSPLIIFTVVMTSFALMWCVYLIVQSHYRVKYFKYTHRKKHTYKTEYLYPALIGLSCLIIIALCLYFDETICGSWDILCFFIFTPVILFTGLSMWTYFDYLKKNLHYLLIDEFKKSTLINTFECFLSHEITKAGDPCISIVFQCSNLRFSHFVQILKAGLRRRKYRFETDEGNYYSLRIKKNKKNSRWQKMSIEQTDNDYEYLICIE
jgi:uncharacterized membrane protein YesL